MKHRRSLIDRVVLTACVAGIAGAAACGPFHRGGTPPAYLYFTNEALDQADVYATVGGNQPIRIGTVLAGQTDTLKVPPDIASRGENVNVIARLLAHSGVVTSGPVPIHPGDRLSVRLPIDQKLLVVLPTSQ